MHNEARPSIGRRFVEPRQQRQWDEFFKRLAPHSKVIRSIVEDAFEMEGKLGFGRMLPTDLESARVAAALHQDDTFKNLKADGIYLTADGNSAVHVEYQSTYNSGMFIRFVMYREAFIEKRRTHKIEKTPYCVLLYSGSEHSIWKNEHHGKKLHQYVDFVFIILEAMEPDAFDNDDLEGRIIGLSRPLATDVQKFVAVMKELDGLSDARSKGVMEQDRLESLKTALVLAGVNKPEIRPWVLGRMRMDEQLRLGLEEILPELHRL